MMDKNLYQPLTTHICISSSIIVLDYIKGKNILFTKHKKSNYLTNFSFYDIIVA